MTKAKHTRRNAIAMLGAGAGAASAALGSSTASAQTNAKSFVLVHGSWHGGWCWREVRQRLSAGGHEVYAPTLAGQGDRRRGLTPQLGIADHVADLTELFWFENLRDVHLVLHSYAGVLAGPVAERAAGGLASVTFLAAFIA